MSKLTLFITTLCALLCHLNVHSQSIVHVLSVEEMFLLADKNNKSLRPFITGIEEAQKVVSEAKNARLPEISASLSFNYLGDACLIDRDLSGGMNAPMPHFGNNFAVEASQLIYAGGAITGAIEIAELQKKNAELTLDANRNDIHFLLTGYYLDLFKYRNMLRVYEKNIEQTEQVVRDIRIKGEEGIVLRNDVTRYELLLSNLELARTQIRNTLKILNNNLVTELGLPDNVVIEPDTSILSKSLPIENERIWTNAAFKSSPILKQMLLSVQIAEQQEKITKSERLPKVALVAGNRLDGPITIEVPPIDKNINYWYAGVNLSYNISSLYRSKQSVTRSKFAVQRTVEQYDALKEHTELLVKAGFINYLEAYEQLNTQRKSVELADQNYTVINNRYKNDMALITDMLDASNSKLDAELQLENARINIIFNYYKLKQVVGDL